jgi:hypothetical protein
MIEIATFLDDVVDEAAGRFAPHPASMPVEPHDCDGCGATTPDVDLWAESWEGEQVWLCFACGDW